MLSNADDIPVLFWGKQIANNKDFVILVCKMISLPWFFEKRMACFDVK